MIRTLNTKTNQSNLKLTYKFDHRFCAPKKLNWLYRLYTAVLKNASRHEWTLMNAARLGFLFWDFTHIAPDRRDLLQLFDTENRHSGTCTPDLHNRSFRRCVSFICGIFLEGAELSLTIPYPHSPPIVGRGLSRETIRIPRQLRESRARR